MNIDVRSNRDFWSGVMLIGLGVAAMVIARNYPMGTALRMGPGYFPTLLGCVLILFGVYIAIRGLRSGENIEGGWSLRALLVLPLSMILFGVLMQHAGFVPALIVLIFVAAIASADFRFAEVAALAVVLTALSVTVFIWGLGLPYPLLAGR